MMPNIIYRTLAEDEQLELLLGGPNRIREAQDITERVAQDGFWVSISFDETIISMPSAISRGPRTVTIAVHRPEELGRDYDSITSILNRIDELILPLEDIAGTDGIRVASIRRAPNARSGNLVDEGYRTATRWAAYGVLHQEYAA